MLKKIKHQPETLKGSPVSIWFDDEWEEYQVKVKGMPRSTYHTDDKQDAIHTAQVIRNTLTRN